MFIAFEGVDGSGKSTQSALLVDRLRSAGHDAMLVCDPGGTPLGRHLRETLKHGCLDMCPMAELQLFNASRAQLLHEVVRPALAKGTIVVSDRYTLSTVVYQGHCGGLCLKDVRDACRIATSEKTADGSVKELRPSRMFVFKITPEMAAARCGGTDRFERRGVEFLRQVAEGYRLEANALIRLGEPVVSVPTNCGPANIAEFVWEHVELMLAARSPDDEAA